MTGRGEVQVGLREFAEGVVSDAGTFLGALETDTYVDRSSGGEPG